MESLNSDIRTTVKVKMDGVFDSSIKENLCEFTYDSIDYFKGTSDISVSKTLTEKQFYTCFLYIKMAFAKNVYFDEKISNNITPVNIDYMSTIMAKPLTYSMPVSSKNDIQTALARELNRTSKSVYSAINRLKKAGYLVISEDGLIVPNKELQSLRKMTKTNLIKYGVCPISYLLNFMVK